MGDVEQQRPAELAVAVSREGEHGYVVSLAGELDISTVAELRAALASVLADDPRLLVFDLGGLRFMDSAAISVMVDAAERVPELRLREPTQIVKRIVEITGLSQVLPVET